MTVKKFFRQYLRNLKAFALSYIIMFAIAYVVGTVNQHRKNHVMFYYPLNKEHQTS